jgi:hypothetical protein
VRLDHIDIPDALANEIEHRTPNATWSQLIEAALRYAIQQADAASPDSGPSDDDTSIPVEQT